MMTNKQHIKKAAKRRKIVKNISGCAIAIGLFLVFCASATEDITLIWEFGLAGCSLASIGVFFLRIVEEVEEEIEYKKQLKQFYKNNTIKRGK